MSKLCPLFSGSSGNSIYIGHRGEGILVDAGRSAKQIEKILVANDIDINSIKHIFVTHEHNDHVSGLCVFASRYKINVHASKGTISQLEKKGIINGKFPCYVIDYEKGFSLNNMEILPFKTSHDCLEGVGYTVSLSDGNKIGICTDLGFISDEVRSAIDDCDVLVVESNYDVEMIKYSSYPHYLKRRILSEKGHLSNNDCAKIVSELVKNRLTRILLSHLSSENNKPQLAFNLVLNELNKNGMAINKDFVLDVAEKINENNKQMLF